MRCADENVVMEILCPNDARRKTPGPILSNVYGIVFVLLLDNIHMFFDNVSKHKTKDM
jgi:hypothetical protein